MGEDLSNAAGGGVKIMDPDIVSSAIYFSKPGKENTEGTLKLAAGRARELGIKTIIVASTSGETGLMAVKVLKDFKVVVVTHSWGSRAPDQQEMPEQYISDIKASGGYVVTAGHALAGIDRAVRRKFNTYELSELIANTLRLFGQGTKVCAEIAMMAADAGLARTDEEVVSVGGTGHGADTALVLKPANTSDFFDMVIKEVICKPRL
jgi:uncharacterized protein